MIDGLHYLRALMTSTLPHSNLSTWCFSSWDGLPEAGAYLIHLLSLYLVSSRILHDVVSLPFCNGWLSFGIQFHLFYELNIQKTKIMAPGPITSWQIDGETKETVTSFIFLDFKITTDGDCSHKIKRHFLLGRRAMTNLDSVLKAKISLCQQRSILSKLWSFQ